MKWGDDDRDLRERFSAVRGEDREEAPGFARVWGAARSRGRARGGRWVLVGFLTAAGLAGVVVVTFTWTQISAPRRRPPGRLTSVSMITEWNPPTDFLLRTPGREILGTLPKIGRYLPDHFPAPRLDGFPPSGERRRPP